MKIAILGDLHLGFDFDGVRAKDSFKQAQEALEIASGADLMLIAGDIFDARIPRQEVWAKALGLFEAMPKKGVEGEFARPVKRIVAIAGTHERRSKSYVNPVQALEAGGFLNCLHLETIRFDLEEPVAVHGMSGVPERYAKLVLDKWGPKPVKGYFNVLMLHQNLKEYVYSEGGEGLTMGDLPKFDMIVAGHVHVRDVTETPNGSMLVLPGSTIRTQLKKAEEEPKGVTFWEDGKLSFVPLKTQKHFHHLTLRFREAKPGEVTAKVKKAIRGLEGIVRVNLKGTLAKDFVPSDVDLKIPFRGILSIGKDLTSERYEADRSRLQKMRKHELSPEELGIQILQAQLGQDPEELFELLRDGKREEVREKVLKIVGGQKGK